MKQIILLSSLTALILMANNLNAQETTQLEEVNRFDYKRNLDVK